jgi:hypothetical protein
VVALLAGCGQVPATAPADFSDLTASPAAEKLDAPTTRETFLAELAPLPHDAVRIEYDVTGPGGMVGTLDLLAAPGGRRRESWSLTLARAHADPIAIKGGAVQTADRAWTDAVDGAAVVRRVPLGPIADAYLRLPDLARVKVMASLRRYHAELAAARATHRGERETVNGQSCLLTRVAGHDLCIWEETGLPLRYQGMTFTILARAITLDGDVDAAAFALPPGGTRAADDDTVFDAASSLERLAEGDAAELGRILQPGLRFADAI